MIGIVAAKVDYAVLASALSSDAQTTLLNEVGAVEAIRDGLLDLLIVSPRCDWWTEVPGIAELQIEAERAHMTVLALVPQEDSEALALAFASGVADCARYPVDAKEVAVRVRALLRRKATAERRRAEAAAARRLALTDPVTGLWNRHYLDAELARLIERADAEARPLSLLMIDIDRFKPINDRHGHVIGDKVLRAVAVRISGGIRASDMLARFGGDELVLAMPDTPARTATTVAERLRALVANGTTEVPFGLTISIGVGELAAGEAAASLLGRADKALYAAKLAGRDRVEAAVA